MPRDDNPTPGSLDEIRAILAHVPGPSLDAGRLAAEREAHLTKPAGALGKMESLTHWFCTWQDAHPPRLTHPRVAVFAGNHGVAARGVSAFPASVTAQMVKNFIAGGAAVNQLCQVADADLRVYDMALDQPTEDFTESAAMSDADCARAIAYGMMAVEPGIDVLCLGEMGIANTTAASAIAAALFGGAGKDWAGPGTGVTGEALNRKIAAIDAGLARHRGEAVDAFDLLRRLGGQELAAICGAIIAARMARVPVLLDGFACTAAGAVLHHFLPGALDHCQVAHLSAEPGHRKLLAHLGKDAILNLNMRLGEGSGAVTALLVLQAAIACHNGMATFADAGVSGKTGA